MRILREQIKRSELNNISEGYSMPARLSRNKFLEIKRYMKENPKAKNSEVVIATDASMKIVSKVRNSRSYPHYKNRIKDSNRSYAIRKAQRDAKKQNSLFKNEDNFLVGGERQHFKKAVVSPQDEVKIHENITRNRITPLTSDDVLADLVRRVSALERMHKQLSATVYSVNDDLGRVKEKLSVTPSYEPSQEPRKFLNKAKKRFNFSGLFGR